MRGKNNLLAGIICASAFCLCGCGGDNSYQKYDNAELYSVGNVEFNANEVREIEIDWWGGSVEIEQSAGKVRVQEDEQEQPDAERMHYYLDEGVLKIKYCQSGIRNRIATQSKHLLVAIPAGVAVDLDCEDVSVSIGNLETTKFSVENVYGNLTAERIVCNQAEIETDSGKVAIEELITNELSLETESGDIRIAKLFADFLDGESKSGNLYLGLQKAVKTKELLENERGNITLALVKGLSATLRFESVSGELQTNKEYAKDGKNYLFDNGEEKGSCHLEVKTFRGNLMIE